MSRSSVTAVLLAVWMWHPAPLWAQNSVDLSGKWTLNTSLSTGPAEVGFGADWATGVPGEGSGGSGGRGRRGGGGGGGSRGSGALPFGRPQSEDDAKRVRQLTDEVRDPSAHLTIADTMTAVTITDDRGQARTFHPDGREEVVQLPDNVPVSVTAKRDPNGALVVLYHVQEGRQLRYIYTRVANPAQLTIEVTFVERNGGGDQVKRVYEPTRANESLQTQARAAAQAAGGAGGGSSPKPPPGTVPAVPPTTPLTPAAPGAGADQTPVPINQAPDAELKGLTKLGLVVEGLSQQATACGVKQNAIETAVTKHLTDAGFKVMPNSDEDSYVYVNVMTSSLSNGYCISRYDVFINTHTATRLSYQPQGAPVLVEIQLLHKGGMTGGPPTTHGDGVVKGALEYVDQFTDRIRTANKQ